MNRSDMTPFDLQTLMNQFASIERNHYRAGTERRENDAEHSLSVTYLAWYFYQSLRPPYDQTQIIKYALIHDLSEAYAGDVNAFASTEARAQKEINEARARRQLEEEFGLSFPEMVELLESYERREDPEARFVWSVDKLQAVMHGELDNWRPYTEIGITFEAFCEKYEEIIENIDPYIEPYFSEVYDLAKQTYPREVYVQPELF